MPTAEQYPALVGKQYAVVVRVSPWKEGGRIKVRTFGPFNRKQAQNVSQKVKRDALRKGGGDRYEVSVCTLFDSPEEGL